MRDAFSSVALAVQLAWERYEAPILVVLCAAFLLVCAHLGAGRTG